ncbi:MAG: transcriptional regulator NrdR [Verrucomicrobiota bacterium]
MRCIKCQDTEDKVIDSRMAKDGTLIRRRRQCLSCGHRFTTYEQLEQTELRVIKRDGMRESFSREKLLSGLLKACEKRPVSINALEAATTKIIHELMASEEREIPTKVIGPLVMKQLKGIDPVAYVRYASVYRQFEDVGEFIDEIQSLERQPAPHEDQEELFVEGSPR